MQRLKAWSVLGVLALVLLSAAVVGRSGGASAGPATRAGASDAIDSAKIEADLQREAGVLMKGETYTPLQTLLKQLDRSKCQVKLAAAGAEKLSPAEIYARCRESVLVLGPVYKCPRCPNWHCAPASGFIISESGVAVTNYHVVNCKNEKTLIARDFAGKVYTVKEVLAASKTNDLAVIQLDGTGFKPLPVAGGEPVGSAVHVISHPDRRFYFFTSGMITQYRRDKGQSGELTDVMEVSAEYGRGSSGAPVLNDRGEVVGVVSSTTSLYYEEQNGMQKNLQMVFRNCIPAQKLLDMIGR